MAMKTLDKEILLVPDDKLDYKPIEDTMTAAELAYHIYSVCLAYTVGTVKGEFKDEDYAIIPFKLENIKTAADIVEYGKKVKAYITDAIETKISETDMDKKITYTSWGGLQFDGFESLSTILEEVIHHRGQLCLYLRMMGIRPHFIYDFS